MCRCFDRLVVETIPCSLSVCLVSAFSTSMSTEENDRALELARRKRKSKRTMCEDTILELKKVLQHLNNSEADEKADLLSSLIDSKISLIELKKELVPLDDDYICVI